MSNHIITCIYDHIRQGKIQRPWSCLFSSATNARKDHKRDRRFHPLIRCPTTTFSTWPSAWIPTSWLSDVHNDERNIYIASQLGKIFAPRKKIELGIYKHQLSWEDLFFWDWMIFRDCGDKKLIVQMGALVNMQGV